MTVNLSSFAGAGWQFFDDNGDPLTGGKVYTYLAGSSSSTPAATYTSSTGAVPHNNPIILDAAGRVPNDGEIWLTNGLNYLFIIKDSTDVLTIGTFDYIPGINDSSDVAALSANLANASDAAKGDALIGFKQANSSGVLAGATARTVHQKLQEFVSVRDFGAAGDGTTDDTMAFQAAMSAVSGGGSVYVPAGTYLLSDTISVTSNITVYGDGYVSQLKRDISAPAFDILDLKNAQNVSVSGMYINGVSKLDNSVAANRYSAIRVWKGAGTAPSNVRIRDITVKYTTNGEIQAEGYRGAITVQDASNVIVSDCFFYDNCGTCILLQDTSEEIIVTNCIGYGEQSPYAGGAYYGQGFGSLISGWYTVGHVMVNNCFAGYFGLSNISLNGPYTTISNCVSVGSSLTNINLGHNADSVYPIAPSSVSTIYGNVCVAAAFEGIFMANASEVNISNNIVFDNGTSSGRAGIKIGWDANYIANYNNYININNNIVNNTVSGPGIQIQSGRNVKISGNIISLNGSVGLLMTEKMATEDMECFVSDNLFYNNGNATGGDSSAIEVNADSSNGTTIAYVAGNYIFSTSIPGYQIMGITATGTKAYIRLGDNIFTDGLYSGPLNTSYAARQGKAYNNFGGSFTAANIPAL